MKSFLAIVAALALSGCAFDDATHVDIGSAPPVAPPALSGRLHEKAPALAPVTDPSMGGVTKALGDTSSAYNDVKDRFNTLIDVYDCVRDGIINKKDLKGCLK